METFKVTISSVGVEMDEEPRHILFASAYVPNKSNAVAHLIVFQNQFLSLLNFTDSAELKIKLYCYSKLLLSQWRVKSLPSFL